MKLLTLFTILLVLTGCSREPWDHRAFGPVEGQPNYRFKSEDESLKLSVYIFSKHRDLDHSGPPFRLKIECVDKRMEAEELTIVDLKIETPEQGIIYSEKKRELAFKVPSFTEGTQPYYSKVVLTTEELDLSHTDSTKAIVSFSYSIDSRIKGEEITVEFEPYTDSGTYKPSM